MKRRGFTLVELLVVIAIIIVLIAILLPSLGRAREISNRSACAANVRGIIQAMNIYGTDNSAAYPIVTRLFGSCLAGDSLNGGAGTPNANLDSLMRQIYTSGGRGNAAQNMWLLVLTQHVTPRQFLCKSDPAKTVSASLSIGGNYQPNFNDGVTPNSKSDLAYSYSWAYMWSAWSVGGWWKSTNDASLPLVADMGTYTTSFIPTNSLTHQREGQNVGFGDGHVEFRREVTVGHNNDNIYAFRGNAWMGNGAGGPIPEGPQIYGSHGGFIGGVPGNWDIYMVPGTDGRKDYSRLSP